MSTFSPAPIEVRGIVNAVIDGVESHKWINEVGLKIDLVFAYGARNDDGELIGDAIKHHGVPALGLCRIIPLKDRAMGRGDAEITFDGDQWDTLPDDQKRALADHEIEHLKLGKGSDDLGRPKLKLRKHDHNFGFFMSVAQRHGAASQEQIQAASMLDVAGQFYWPELVKVADATGGAVTISAEGHEPVTMSNRRFSQIAKEMGKK